MQINIPDPNDYVVFAGVSGNDYKYYGFGKRGHLEYLVSSISTHFRLMSLADSASAQVAIEDSVWVVANTDELPSEVQGYVATGLLELENYLGLDSSVKENAKQARQQARLDSASGANEVAWGVLKTKLARH